MPFWHASVPFKRTLTIVKFCDRMKTKRRNRAIKSQFRGMQPMLWIIQYFYCRQLYLMLAGNLCVVGFALCNEINAVAKLSRGINNFCGIRDQNFQRFWDQGSKFGVKNEISYETIYLVTTLNYQVICVSLQRYYCTVLSTR